MSSLIVVLVFVLVDRVSFLVVVGACFVVSVCCPTYVPVLKIFPLLQIIFEERKFSNVFLEYELSTYV